MDETNGKELNPLWDSYVPIVTTSTPQGLLSVIHIVNEIVAPKEYVEVISLLEAAKPEDVVIFNLNTPGGSLATTMMILDAMEVCDATLVARISGEVASAGTMIVMACDNIEIAKWGSLMIHNYSGGLYGKGHELKARLDFEHPHLTAFFHDLYRPFLSKKECNLILEGADKYMNATEIIERWGKVTKRREKQQEKALQEEQDSNTAGLVEYLGTLGYTVEKQ